MSTLRTISDMLSTLADARRESLFAAETFRTIDGECVAGRTCPFTADEMLARRRRWEDARQESYAAQRRWLAAASDLSDFMLANPGTPS